MHKSKVSIFLLEKINTKMQATINAKTRMQLQLVMWWKYDNAD